MRKKGTRNMFRDFEKTKTTFFALNQKPMKVFKVINKKKLVIPKHFASQVSASVLGKSEAPVSSKHCNFVAIIYCIF